jgi:hypothetical protein
VSLLKEIFQEEQENERLSFLVKEINSMAANANCNLPGTKPGLSHSLKPVKSLINPLHYALIL